MFERPAIVKPNAVRLDASETVWFKRQLEAVDRQQYDVVFPENKARELIPTQQGIPDWARVYTWRMFTKVGRAKIIGNKADDIPRSDATGAEDSKVIKPVASSYGYDIFEIKAAAATGTPLDAMRAASTRHSIETEVDEILAIGNTEHNLEGLLSLSGTQTSPAATKTGGGTNWVNGTPKEIQADIRAAINKIIDANKGAGGPQFRRFVIVVPEAQYGHIAQEQFSAASDTTILRWLLDNNPFIEDIIPWHRCSGAGGGATDRMIVYPRNPLVVAGIVPMEVAFQEAEKRGLEYIIDGISTCGGVVCRYPFVICYCDGV